MTSSSPPTRRVVEGIEFLGEHRGMPIRLSDIVQALGLNQATAHTILKELVETGWVTRDPLKQDVRARWGLGSAGQADR